MSKSKLAVVILAALAMMAVGSTAAHAAKFNAAKYPALISGTQTVAKGLSFNFEDSTTAKCESFAFAGEMAKESSENLTLTPGWTGCTAFTLEATITPNECDFVLHPGSGSSDTWAGTFDISCPEGKKIVIVAGNCEVKIGTQSGKGPVNYSINTAATPDDIEATFALTTGLTYEKSKDGLLCDLTGTGTLSTGTLTGTATLSAGEKETLIPIDFGIK